MMFFEFLDSLNEAHSQVKGLVKASEVRQVKAMMLDVAGGDFRVRDQLQGYGLLMDSLAISNFPCPADLSHAEFERIRYRAIKELLQEIYQLSGGLHHEQID